MSILFKKMKEQYNYFSTPFPYQQNNPTQELYQKILAKNMASNPSIPDDLIPDLANALSERFLIGCKNPIKNSAEFEVFVNREFPQLGSKLEEDAKEELPPPSATQLLDRLWVSLSLNFEENRVKLGYSQKTDEALKQLDRVEVLVDDFRKDKTPTLKVYIDNGRNSVTRKIVKNGNQIRMNEIMLAAYQSQPDQSHDRLKAGLPWFEERNRHLDNPSPVTQEIGKRYLTEAIVAIAARQDDGGIELDNLMKSRLFKSQQEAIDFLQEVSNEAECTFNIKTKKNDKFPAQEFAPTKRAQSNAEPGRDSSSKQKKP